MTSLFGEPAKKVRTRSENVVVIVYLGLWAGEMKQTAQDKLGCVYRGDHSARSTCCQMQGYAAEVCRKRASQRKKTLVILVLTFAIGSIDYPQRTARHDRLLFVYPIPYYLLESNPVHFVPSWSWVCPIEHDYAGLLNPKDMNTTFSNAGSLEGRDQLVVACYIGGDVGPPDFDVYSVL